MLFFRFGSLLCVSISSLFLLVKPHLTCPPPHYTLYNPFPPSGFSPYTCFPLALQPFRTPPTSSFTLRHAMHSHSTINHAHSAYVGYSLYTSLSLLSFLSFSFSLFCLHPHLYRFPAQQRNVRINKSRGKAFNNNTLVPQSKLTFLLSKRKIKINFFLYTRSIQTWAFFSLLFTPQGPE